jgi:3-hydroxyacyl-[acyl-carrier-protein] dehydratase
MNMTETAPGISPATPKRCAKSSVLSQCALSHVEIARIMPHATPFLLLDRVIEIDPGRSGKAIKNITANDPFLLGHFPGKPIMPGVLIVEACGQLAAVVCGTERLADPRHSVNEEGEPLEILAMIERFKFLRRVTPGDQLILQASIGRRVQNMVRIEVSARVGSNLVAEGVLVATRGT